MDVLVANHSLSGIDGSIKYNYSIIEELLRRGHSVDGFGVGNDGGGSTVTEQRLREMNVPLYIGAPPTKKYDLILSSGKTSIYHLDRVDDICIHTNHGIHVEEEEPFAHPLIKQLVSVSKEVKDFTASKGFTSEIIYNGINTKTFKIDNPINKSLKKILSLTHNQLLNDRLSNICNKLGIEFIYNHKKDNPVFDIEKKINEVDLVITIGRGVYEAMSCGRVVFCLDKREYVGGDSIGDGIVTDTNINYIIQNNCSGRYTNKVFTDTDIIEELSKYDYRLGEFGREYVTTNLTIEQSVDKYLNLYEQFR